MPPVFMRSGDVVEVEVEAVGRLHNPVVDEDQLESRTPRRSRSRDEPGSVHLEHDRAGRPRVSVRRSGAGDRRASGDQAIARRGRAADAKDPDAILVAHVPGYAMSTAPSMRPLSSSRNTCGRITTVMIATVCNDTRSATF